MFPQARGSGSGCPSRSSELTRRPDRLPAPPGAGEDALAWAGPLR